MRAVVLTLGAGGAGWAAIHESVRWLSQGPGLEQPSLVFSLVAIPAGLLGALAGVTVLGLLLPAAR